MSIKQLLYVCCLIYLSLVLGSYLKLHSKGNRNRVLTLSILMPFFLVWVCIRTARRRARENCKGQNLMHRLLFATRVFICCITITPIIVSMIGQELLDLSIESGCGKESGEGNLKKLDKRVSNRLSLVGFNF